MKPQLLLGSVFAISSAFAVGMQSAFLLGTGGTVGTDYTGFTLLNYIGDLVYTRRELGYASTVQLVLFGMMIGSWYIINRLLSRWGTDE
jgi:ABC-type sugar transport system permease subunit